NENGEAVRFFPGRESGRVEIQIEITGQPPDSSWESAFEQNKTIIEDFKHDTTSGGIYFRITTPLHDNSNLVAGLISLEISVEAINDIMYENNPHNGLGRSGESYLVGSDYLMRSTSRFQDNSVFKTKVKTTGVQEAFNNITANSIIKDYRNIDVLSSYSKVIIPGLNWVILAEIDLKEAMIPIIEIRNRILFLFILIAILIFGFSYFFSTRFTKPVIKLKEEAVRIGRGEKGSPLEKKSNDEIGQLTDSFNLMAEKIHEQKEFLRIERMRSLQALIDGQDNERQRLSRELHDGLGQLLIALKLKYESLFDDQEQNPGAVELSLLFDKTIEETRRISNNLMPAVLVEFGLDTALKTLCEDVKRNSGLDVAYSSSIKSESLPEEYKVPVYRIVQESLNNAVKHAKADRVSVIINMIEKTFSLEIIDDGIGFDVHLARKNLNARGLKNIEERVELMGGDLTISSQANKGTRIIIRISTNRNNEKN
ncbi:MAG: ATP-binding protein, partial [Bacteroidota bacterium]